MEIVTDFNSEGYLEKNEVYIKKEPQKMKEDHFKIYIIRNKEGKYFKSRGQNSYKSRWVDNLSEAKKYDYLRNARKEVTYWFNHYPDYGICDILEFIIKDFNILNEEERVSRVIKKIREEESQMENKRNSEYKRKLEETIDRCQKELRGL